MCSAVPGTTLHKGLPSQGFVLAQTPGQQWRNIESLALIAVVAMLGSTSRIAISARDLPCTFTVDLAAPLKGGNRQRE